jgi:hypothetical protein
VGGVIHKVILYVCDTNDMLITKGSFSSTILFINHLGDVIFCADGIQSWKLPHFMSTIFDGMEFRSKNCRAPLQK